MRLQKSLRSRNHFSKASAKAVAGLCAANQTTTGECGSYPLNYTRCYITIAFQSYNHCISISPDSNFPSRVWSCETRCGLRNTCYSLGTIGACIKYE